MRRGNRRGLAIGDALRIDTRQAVVEDSESSGDESDGVESPFDSPSPFPSPTESAAFTQSLSTSTDLASATSITSLPTVAISSAITTTAVVLPTSSASSGEAAPILASSSAPTISLPTAIPTTSSQPQELVPTSFETQTSSFQTGTTTDGGASVTQAPASDGIGDSISEAGASRTIQRNGTIAGAVIGSVGGAIAIAVLGWLYIRSRRNRQKREETLQPQGLAAASGHGRDRFHKSDSRIMDQVMAAVYSGGSARGSFSRGAAGEADWYPDEKSSVTGLLPPGGSSKHLSAKPIDSIRAWLEKLGNHAPSIRSQKVTSVTEIQDAWPRAAVPPSNPAPMNNGEPEPAAAIRPPPPVFPPLAQQTMSHSTPPRIPPPPPSEGSSRNTIQSSSTWYRWG